MNRFLLVIILIIGAVIVWQIWSNPAPNMDLSFNEKEIRSHNVPQVPTNPIFEEINANQKKIQSFQARLSLVLTRRSTVNLYGDLYYEKPKNFRMRLNSIVGNEVDVGSNSSYVWYWSKRDKNPALYYVSHEDIINSKLKTPFNPPWLVGSLGLKEIKYLDASKIDVLGKYWRIFRNDIDGQGRSVIVCMVIDPDKKVVVGRYVYTQNSKMIASSEIKEFQKVGEFLVPKRITMIWYDESAVLDWRLSDVKVNHNINPSFWNMPNKNPKIDMSKD